MLILSFFLSFLFRCQCKDGRAFFFCYLNEWLVAPTPHEPRRKSKRTFI